MADEAWDQLIAATLASGVMAAAERRQTPSDAVRAYRSILAELRKPSDK